VNDFVTALALVLVIEGLLYAVAPEGMRRVAAMAAVTPANLLRRTGLVAAAIGVAAVWLVRS